MLVDALDRHMATYTATDPDAPVFVGPEGRALSRTRLSKVWKQTKEATGVPHELRLYDLCHYHGTQVARKPGVTTREVMSRLGHTTMRAAILYQHASAERDREVANFLDDLANDVRGRPGDAAVGG